MDVSAQELKAGKMQYRAAFDALRERRSALDAQALSLAEAKKALIVEFDKWLPAVSGMVIDQLGSRLEFARDCQEKN